MKVSSTKEASEKLGTQFMNESNSFGEQRDFIISDKEPETFITCGEYGRPRKENR